MSAGGGGFKYAQFRNRIETETRQRDAREMACSEHNSPQKGCMYCKGRCIRLMNGIETR